MSRFTAVVSFVILSILAACSSAKNPPPPLATASAIPSPVPSGAPYPVPTASTRPTTPVSSASPLPSLPPTASSLKAVVTADRLSCRYGPGAEYLYLYGLRKGANIVLIGRTDGNNWVWVDGRNRCWVNAKFIDIAGDQGALPVVYPGFARLPRSPYYPPTVILSAVRVGDKVTVEWSDVPLRPGDEEDESMLHYIIEAWRCENGRLLFDPLATNDTSITLIDQPGCDEPSHGRVFVQEKHGFAGPAEIPWPAPSVPAVPTGS